jgi:hypothetical protein
MDQSGNSVLEGVTLAQSGTVLCHPAAQIVSDTHVELTRFTGQDIDIVGPTHGMYVRDRLQTSIKSLAPVPSLRSG